MIGEPMLKNVDQLAAAVASRIRKEGYHVWPELAGWIAQAFRDQVGRLNREAERLVHSGGRLVNVSEKFLQDVRGVLDTISKHRDRTDLTTFVEDMFSHKGRGRLHQMYEEDTTVLLTLVEALQGRVAFLENEMTNENLYHNGKRDGIREGIERCKDKFKGVTNGDTQTEGLLIKWLDEVSREP